MNPIATAPFISKATLARYDDWAFKTFLCSTLFIIFFSVAAIHSWPPMAKHASILLACTLPAAMVTLVRIPTWFSERRIPKEVLWALVVFILGLTSSFLSENSWPTLKSTVLFMASGPFIFITTMYLFKSKRSQEVFLWMASLAALCLCFWGIFEYRYLGRVHLYSENPLPAGASLILLSASPMILLIRERSTFLRLLLIFSLIFSLLIIILLAKKGPVLGLIIMLLFWVGFITRGRLKLLLGIALLAGCVLLISKSPFPKYKHFYELGASFQIRLENYLFSSQVFKENAVWGAGFHADLTRNLDDYAPKLFAKGLEYQYKGHFQTYNTFENIFIAFLVEMGGLFSITYFGGVAYLLIVFFKKFRAPPQKNLAGILTISVMAGFAFISCTFDTLRFPNLNWLFHSLLGLMVNLQNSGGNRSEPS